MGVDRRDGHQSHGRRSRDRGVRVARESRGASDRRRRLAAHDEHEFDGDEHDDYGNFAASADALEQLRIVITSMRQMEPRFATSEGTTPTTVRGWAGNVA